MGEINRIDLIRARFSDAPWRRNLSGKVVTVVGSGGIGSWVTLCLARIGCKVYLYDADLVETHNLGGQMLSINSIGEAKVEEVSRLCMELCGPNTHVIAMQEMFDGNSPVSPIMVLAVDNMATRKLVYEMWREEYGDQPNSVLIDGRLLAEDYQVYTVTRDRLKLYEGTLFSDEEVPTESCSLKATTHCSLGIASDMIGCLTNWAANLASRRKGEAEVRDVPFSIVKCIPNFFYDLNFSDDREHKEEGDDNQGVLPVSVGQPAHL